MGRLAIPKQVLSFFFLCVAAFLSLPSPSVQSGQAASWFEPFEYDREFYVAADGDGGGSVDDPMAFDEAIATAEPGAVYWLLEGVYRGIFAFEQHGTEDAPIVFRAYPGDHVQIIGKIDLLGEHTWLWGMDISDPEETADDTGVELRAAGTRLINNYIHHHSNANNVGAWNLGEGQVIYGNVIHSNGKRVSDGESNPHNIYSQNSYDDFGYKYYVDNVILDADLDCHACFNFHAYGEGGIVTGFYMLNNIIANGRFLIGGFGLPADNNYVQGNVFFRSGPQFGYRRPAQVQFLDNRVYQSTLSMEWFWGDGEGQYEQEVPNIITGNMIFDPVFQHIKFRTAIYTDEEERLEGIPRIQSSDIVDDNVYSAPFAATFEAGGQSQQSASFEAWQALTQEAGKAFDQNSVVIPTPRAPQVTIVPNQYEAGRANIAVYASAGADAVQVDLSDVLADGTAYRIYPAVDLYGTPLVQGSYEGPVTLPMNGEQFMAYIVLQDIP